MEVIFQLFLYIPGLFSRICDIAAVITQTQLFLIPAANRKEEYIIETPMAMVEIIRLFNPDEENEMKS